MSIHLHVARDHPERSGNLYKVWRDVVAKYPEIWRAKLKEARERKAEMWAQKFEEVLARANGKYGPKGHEIISMGIRVKGSTATWLVCKNCRRDTRELAKRERRETRTPLCVPVLTDRQVEGAKFIPTMLTWKRWTKTRPQDHLQVIMDKMGMGEEEREARERLLETTGDVSMKPDAIWVREKKERMRRAPKKRGRPRGKGQKGGAARGSTDEGGKKRKWGEYNSS